MGKVTSIGFGKGTPKKQDDLVTIFVPGRKRSSEERSVPSLEEEQSINHRGQSFSSEAQNKSAQSEMGSTTSINGVKKTKQSMNMAHSREISSRNCPRNSWRTITT